MRKYARAVLSFCRCARTLLRGKVIPERATLVWLPEWIWEGRLVFGLSAQVAEWLMAADCKSAALRSYGGSNPPLCTSTLL